MDELETFVLSYEGTIREQNTTIVNAHIYVKNAEEFIEKLMLYVRFLQLLVSKIYVGEINGRVRVAVEKVHKAWLLHKSTIDLGGDRRTTITDHIVAMIGKTDYFLGLELDELKKHVFDSD